MKAGTAHSSYSFEKPAIHRGPSSLFDQGHSLVAMVSHFVLLKVEKFSQKTLVRLLHQ